MPNPSKWLLIGVLIILAIGIIGIGFYAFNEFILIEKEFKKEIEAFEESVRKLEEYTKQLQKETYKMQEETSRIDTSNWSVYQNKDVKFELKFPPEIELHPYSTQLIENSKEYEGVGLDIKLKNRLTGCILKVYIGDDDLLLAINQYVKSQEPILYKILTFEGKTYGVVLDTASHAVDPTVCLSIFNEIYPTFRPFVK